MIADPRTRAGTSMSGACAVGVLLGMIASGACASGQSLMSTPPPPPPEHVTTRDEQAELRATSLILVEEPKPRDYEIHDKVTIIISETSRQSSQQKLDSKKDTSFKASLRDFPDLGKLINGELDDSESNPITAVDVGSGQSFKGDGKYERSDRFTDRITATVMDVKPNGVLVLEARRAIIKDKEAQTLVLTGECRKEDVTAQNTVLSNQLADLVLVVENEGDVKDAAHKGWITRFFEAVFDF